MIEFIALLRLFNWSYIIRHPITFIQWLKILNHIEKYGGLGSYDRPILGMRDKHWWDIQRSRREIK